jgi:hypothetical protein
MTEKEEKEEKGQDLYADLFEVTGIYIKMWDKGDGLATALSSASVAYFLTVHKNIIECIDNASDTIEMIDHLKILICKHFDKLLRDRKNEENSLGLGSS